MPTHIHADAVTLTVLAGALIFELAVLKGLVISMLARYPDSAAWQGLAFIVGL